jgi:hypothetical protein
MARDIKASRPRQKTLAGMRHENADTDHAKEWANYLDRHDGLFAPGGDETASRPEQSKKSIEPCRFTQRLMIRGNRGCQNSGRQPARPA